MLSKKESIFLSASRSFVISMFAILGLCLGIIIISIILGIVFSSGSPIQVSKKQVKVSSFILPDANGSRKILGNDSPVILKIDIKGTIGVDELNDQNVDIQLIQSREGSLANNRVKGILLCINSPGGTVVGSDNIYRAIKQYKERYNIPVYAFVDGICASGGMYVAASADKIYASEISIVGSVGVLLECLNVHKLLEKIGVEPLAITSGKNKDLMNPLRPWEQKEKQVLQQITDYMYNHFVDIITTERNIDRNKLINEYGALIFTSTQAKEYGFIDNDCATYKTVLQELVKAANIDTNYQVIQFKTKDWLLKLLHSKSPLLTGKIKHKFDFANKVLPDLNNEFLYLYRPNIQ